jgi:hypothetical protein
MSQPWSFVRLTSWPSKKIRWGRISNLRKYNSCINPGYLGLNLAKRDAPFVHQKSVEMRPTHPSRSLALHMQMAPDTCRKTTSDTASDACSVRKTHYQKTDVLLQRGCSEPPAQSQLYSSELHKAKTNIASEDNQPVLQCIE